MNQRQPYGPYGAPQPYDFYGPYGAYGAPQPYGFSGGYASQPSVDNRGGSYQPISGTSGNGNTFNSNPNNAVTGNKLQNIEKQYGGIHNSGNWNNAGPGSNLIVGNDNVQGSGNGNSRSNGWTMGKK